MRKKPFILIDLGNVMFTFDNGLEELANRLGVSEEEIREYFLQIDTEICTGYVSPESILKLYENHFQKKVLNWGLS